jgi:hypothetical protein
MSDMDEETASKVANTMLRAMVAVASAGSPIEPPERQTMKGFLQESVGAAPDDETIDGLSEALAKFEGTIREVVAVEAGAIPDTVKPAIIQACYFVMTASLPVGDEQTETIARVGEGLGLDQAGFDEAIKGAQEMIESAEAMGEGAGDKDGNPA